MAQHGRPRATVVVFVPHYKYSVMCHLEGLPATCLLRGVDGELSPLLQSVGLADEMERRGLAYEFYAYEGLKHYFSTRAFREGKQNGAGT